MTPEEKKQFDEFRKQSHLRMIIDNVRLPDDPPKPVEIFKDCRLPDFPTQAPVDGPPQIYKDSDFIRGVKGNRENLVLIDCRLDEKMTDEDAQIIEQNFWYNHPELLTKKPVERPKNKIIQWLRSFFV